MAKQLAAFQGASRERQVPASLRRRRLPPSHRRLRRPRSSLRSDGARIFARCGCRPHLNPRNAPGSRLWVRRYTARTKASKEWTQDHRGVMADPRVVTGFRPAVKELVYPIVIQRSAGARVWDLDAATEVHRLPATGSAAIVFGWQLRDGVTRAVERQLQTSGHEIGPQTPLARASAQSSCAS